MSEPRKYVLTIPAYYKPTASRHPAYGQWAAMLSRCRNKNIPKFRDYGGRGISVCSRWVSGENGMTGFECFMQDMGNKPTARNSLDRIDNDGNYDPENCRWATPNEQANNRRSNHKLTHKGETLSMMDMAERHGISYYVLRDRIMRGWPISEAIENPNGKGWRPPRTAKGSMLPQSVLTEDDVRAIRDERTNFGTPMSVFCRRYNVTMGTISMLINRKTWAHVS